MFTLIFTREGSELLKRPIGSETISVGRSHDNTIQLVDPSISRTHCLIENTGDTITLTDTSRNGTTLNGRTISSAVLKQGDEIAIGPWTATVDVRMEDRVDETIVDHFQPTSVMSYDSDSKQLGEDVIFITVSSKEQRPFKRRLSKGEITLGSHAACDIAIADEYISRCHCKLILTADSLVLSDCGSTNGTFVGGIRIDRTALPLEGSFAIGETTVRYARERVTERISPCKESAMGSMLGKGREMRETFSLIKRVAPTDVTVCILGESGTGKELAAREIHRHSLRSDKPFLALNCGSIPATIVESLLFGHERGAFTGAVERQEGLFEQANGGTLFLDEIGEMELNLQTRLLRVLEERTVRRLGAKENIAIDVRLIVATNRDLKQLVQERAFREDLFYRLYVVPLQLPPLRHRREDIPLLAQHFVEEHAPVDRGLKLSREALVKLSGHEWRGNVRELKNVLTRAAVMAEGMHIRADDINLDGALRTGIPADDELNDHERNALVAALRRTNGNQSKAARILGVARTTVAYKIGRYGINLKNI